MAREVGMRTAIARLDIEVFVNCPHCDFMIDLMNSDDTSGYNHNEEGAVISQACPNGHWSEEHKGFSIDDVECTKCRNRFNVKELDW
jgi:hypothetical protein